MDVSLASTVVLDARPLSKIVHPRKFEDIAENTQHLAPYVPAVRWQEFEIEDG
jgi:hypothetical protein